MKAIFALTAAGLLLADGIFFGLWTNRWQTSHSIPAAVAGLQRVPMVIGDWKGQPLPDFKQNICDQAGFAGYLNRRYDNPARGISVSVMLACGPFGPMSVHTPDICYAGGGFTQHGTVSLHKEDSLDPKGPIQFWNANFSRPDPLAPGNLKVYWAWNAGQGWQAPENPRLTFAGAPVLYKLYISRELLDEKDQKADEKTREFFKVFLPELEKALVFHP
jgi:hypothetical protein